MSALRPGLYPRNRHNGRYDFATLYQVTPELTQLPTLTPDGKQSVDFVNLQTVKALNKALLVHFYVVKSRDIPDGFLCPPVLGRADYIYYLADPLDETSGAIPVNASVLDMRIEANCVYPLIGVYEYGRRLAGSETNNEAFNSVQTIINVNPGLTRAIRLRRQKDATAIFNGIVRKNEQYEATLCNPSFHGSAASACAGNGCKCRGLEQDKDDALNFGGRQQELWCEGDGVALIKRMITESQAFGRQVTWFTTLVSRGENLLPLYHVLADAGAVEVVKKEAAQGQKQSHFIA